MSDSANPPVVVNPFAASGLFQNTANVWSPFKMSFEGFAGGGKTFTMCACGVGLWIAEGKRGNVILVDTERSVKFIAPFLAKFGLVEGRNFFVTHSRDLLTWGKILAMCEAGPVGNILLTDTVTHIYEQMLIQFEADQQRKVKYPQDAMLIKPMWKEKFSNPFVRATKTHLLFTGRAAWEYTMSEDADTGKKEFNPTGVKMRGDNELAYEPDVVVLMERLQKVLGDNSVEVARGATILKDRSRQIDGQFFVFKPYKDDDDGSRKTDEELQQEVWSKFEPVYRLLSTGSQTQLPAEAAMGPLFVKGRGEEWYRERQRAERIVEEIAGIYSQWGLGGSGAAEKSVRAILNKLVYGERSTVALAEKHPDQLSMGLDVLEFLTRYAQKNMEFIERSFKASQYDEVNEFLDKAQKEYLDQLSKAPTIQQDGDMGDDDLPDYKVPSKEETPVVPAEKMVDFSISPEVAEEVRQDLGREPDHSETSLFPLTGRKRKAGAK